MRNLLLLPFFYILLIYNCNNLQEEKPAIAKGQPKQGLLLILAQEIQNKQKINAQSTNSLIQISNQNDSNHATAPK
jgi:hypothetical protein